MWRYFSGGKLVAKTCSSCKETKNAEFFGRASNTCDKLKHYCKQCRRDKEKKSRNKPENKAKRIAQRKEYNSRPEIIERRKQYNSNPERQAHVREWINKRRKENPEVQLASNLRTRLRDCLVRQLGTKSAKTLELIGCSVKFLRKYLEYLFEEHMSWENYGLDGWVIDHIIPCASFDLTDPVQQRQCFHYTNLQPLWWWHNLEKSDKILNTEEHCHFYL